MTDCFYCEKKDIQNSFGYAGFNHKEQHVMCCDSKECMDRFDGVIVE